MIHDHIVDPIKAQGAYTLIVDTLMAADRQRAEAVVGLLAVLATQYNGGQMLSSDQMSVFVKDSSDWLAAYFGSK